jgi:hypothetical protein
MLTKTLCTAANYRGNPNGSAARRYVIRETEMAGFALRVFPSGVTVFVPTAIRRPAGND